MKGMQCPKCGRFMRVTYRRDDGCRIFDCFDCEVTIGEETEEWFRKMEKIVSSESEETK